MLTESPTITPSAESQEKVTHSEAKLLLEQAKTFKDREGAIRQAMKLGMPLCEIEEYLDWLDMMSTERSKVDQALASG